MEYGGERGLLVDGAPIVSKHASIVLKIVANKVFAQSKIFIFSSLYVEYGCRPPYMATLLVDEVQLAGREWHFRNALVKGLPTMYHLLLLNTVQFLNDRQAK